ncbi:unnamed protein product [Symbiodinium natans]|uniref:Uncharacterized protein n=1 Tax=Symbiodinium natans TaxID=878477 RepID=A0A812P2H0_9DINO|nr:unnamed protein product [Symbiodinium natans]
MACCCDSGTAFGAALDVTFGVCSRGQLRSSLARLATTGRTLPLRPWRALLLGSCTPGAAGNRCGVYVRNAGLLRGNWSRPVLDWFNTAKSNAKQRQDVARHLAKLQLPSTATVFDLHRRHVLDVIRARGWEVDYFLCFSALSPEILREENITEAWAFSSRSQWQRMAGCLRRVRVREDRCGGARYSIFFRLRETFLALTDAPNLTKALPRPTAPQGCVMVRFRGTRGMSGVTNDMHSISPCDGCVGEGIRTQVGMMLDDMVQVVPRHLLRFFEPGADGPVAYPPWFQHGSYDEGSLAKRTVKRGIPLCSLSFRGWPLGSTAHKFFLTRSRSCDFFNGAPRTICGKGAPVDEQLQKLPHLDFLGPPS